MKNKSTSLINQTFLRYISTLIVLFLLFCMITNPARYINSALNGISAWAFNVLPSVLPFMFFTRLLSSLDTLAKLTKPFSFMTQKLFRTPPISMYTFLMAILSGYPVGSKIVADLYMQGKISQEESFRILSFCSTSGPMFIVGAVGVKMFGSTQIGHLLFLSHILGAILNGIIFRFLHLKNSQKRQEIFTKNQAFDISEIVLNSTLSILSVGCIIAIFFIVIESFMPALNMLPQSISALLQGIIEITKGSISLAALPNKFYAVCSASFIISFGGLSTILQSIAMISKLNMPTALFIYQKLVHGILSCAITFLLLLI